MSSTGGTTSLGDVLVSPSGSVVLLSLGGSIVLVLKGLHETEVVDLPFVYLSLFTKVCSGLLFEEAKVLHDHE